VPYGTQVIEGRADPALVFGEILGVIKGSEKTIGTQQRCLDRDTYSSSGLQGSVSLTKETVYDLFTTYTKLKRQRQEYDAADRSAAPLSQQCITEFDHRTHHILKELRDADWVEEKKGKKVDFLSVKWILVCSGWLG